MAGMDDNVAIIGDWVPPSPSPRDFFSSMLVDGIGSRSFLESPSSNKAEEFWSREGNTNGKNLSQENGTGDEITAMGSFSEYKSNSRGGLVDRIAARAGFNAPRLNTESIRSSDLSLNSDVRSPYLTIPPGLSPTTLLDSPVFLSNSLVS